MSLGAATFGNGKFRPLAAALTRRWNRLNDFPCRDLSDVVPWDALHGKWGFAKAYFWDLVPDHVDRLLVMDADVFPLRRMPADALPDVAFAAVDDHPNQLQLRREADPRLNALEKTFNSGIFLARRAETQPIFNELKTRPRPGGYTFEQDDLNLLVHERLGGYTELPPEFNWRQRHAWKVGAACDLRRIPYLLHFAGFMDHTILRVLHELLNGSSMSIDRMTIPWNP